MLSGFLCGVNLPAQVHLVANSPSHFSVWEAMSFYIERNVFHLSSSPAISKSMPRAASSCGKDRAMNPSCMLRMSLVFAALTPFSVDEEWRFSWTGAWRIKYHRAFEWWGTADPTGYLPHIHSPTASPSLAEIWLVQFYPKRKAVPSPAHKWILINLSLARLSYFLCSWLVEMYTGSLDQVNRTWEIFSGPSR